MKVKDIMTENPACCVPESSIQDAARLMADCDCGEIPVLENAQSCRVVGVITDRDIACRAVAHGKDFKTTKVQEIMSSPVITVSAETDLEKCCRIMEENQVRRIPVADRSGRCVGIVAQADIARSAGEHETAEFVRDVSRRTGRPSMVGSA
jgi:CBS domain-containing protein